jgi:hypothetical protein
MSLHFCLSKFKEADEFQFNLMVFDIAFMEI